MKRTNAQKSALRKLALRRETIQQLTIAQRHALRADEPGGVDVVVVAADRGDPAVLDADLEAAACFAEGTDPVCDGCHGRTLPRSSVNAAPKSAVMSEDRDPAAA